MNECVLQLVRIVVHVYVTRICDTSSTIIDNIFSNEMCSNDASGIFVNHMSDHQAIFTITSTKLNNRMEQQYVSIETKDDVSLNNFITEVRNMNISEIVNSNINANPIENNELKRQSEFTTYEVLKILA